MGTVLDALIEVCYPRLYNTDKGLEDHPFNSYWHGVAEVTFDKNYDLMNALHLVEGEGWPDDLSVWAKYKKDEWDSGFSWVPDSVFNKLVRNALVSDEDGKESSDSILLRYARVRAVVHFMEALRFDPRTRGIRILFARN